MPRAVLSTSIPLEARWRAILDAAASSVGLIRSTDAALSAQLRRLSEAYNLGHPVGDELLGARLHFSLPRDIAKGYCAMRELVSSSALPTGKTLRVLDIGAGLGAMSWGAKLAERDHGIERPHDWTWLDADETALRTGRAVALAAQDDGVTVRSEVHQTATHAHDVERLMLRHEPFDVVLVGQAVSEFDRNLTDAQRLERHPGWVHSLVRNAISENGSVVIVEPALRDRTRHLHRMRDALVGQGVTVFAPCLHQGACPALRIETDWCHEDLPVDLPAWLIPLARAAGLRWQGLSFSYLVLRRDGETLARRLAPDGLKLRAVSDLLRTKGKRECFMCGEFEHGPDRARLGLLDRHASDSNRVWEKLNRGDLVAIQDPWDRAKARLLPDTIVQRCAPRVEIDRRAERQAE